MIDTMLTVMVFCLMLAACLGLLAIALVFIVAIDNILGGPLQRFIRRCKKGGDR